MRPQKQKNSEVTFLLVLYFLVFFSFFWYFLHVLGFLSCIGFFWQGVGGSVVFLSVLFLFLGFQVWYSCCAQGTGAKDSSILWEITGVFMLSHCKNYPCKSP